MYVKPEYTRHMTSSCPGDLKVFLARLDQPKPDGKEAIPDIALGNVRHMTGRWTLEVPVIKWDGGWSIVYSYGLPSPIVTLYTELIYPESQRLEGLRLVDNTRNVERLDNVQHTIIWSR